MEVAVIDMGLGINGVAARSVGSSGAVLQAKNRIALSSIPKMDFKGLKRGFFTMIYFPAKVMNQWKRWVC